MAQNPEMYDLLVIGAGPAGLSAAITAESEGINTLVIDSSERLGGQASQSSCIENYPGFPGGVSGADLMNNMVDQALAFSTEFRGPTRVTDLDPTETGIMAKTDGGEEYFGRAALLSTGVEFIHLSARNIAAYNGRGVHYGPPPTNADYSGKNIVVIGGANSAGQAAVALSSFEACNVHLLIRGDSIEDKMSNYLIEKVAEHKNIEVHTKTELVGVDGNGRLSTATIKDEVNERDMDVDEIFVFVGSKPKTLWLPAGVHKDEKNFVMSAEHFDNSQRDAFAEATNGRLPYSHETSMPNLFVAGDVRCGTPKRVALAVGDGASVIPQIHNLRSRSA